VVCARELGLGVVVGVCCELTTCRNIGQPHKNRRLVSVCVCETCDV
jgi:hypothetical protein